ncbi:F0F1 ATP synthase subunit A [Blattabacterium cuenoti]|uniref:ATP synthase subunit a n=1 Tax=Blattabacterium sp. (Carbrunneria paramaxi) TaxID=2712795 RepID=A0A6G6BY54_9FLAO|nr:F0F1 ATP synthase subunit A [Blattabacterium cuenoti]QID56917.1 ATP synthase subunit A [Blattabacterium sp. (Carbrunneria paramaxi)]
MISKNLLFLFLSLFLYKNTSNTLDDINKDKKNKINISHTIFEHINDSYEWNIIGNHNNGIILYFPIILWNRNHGLEIFSSYKLSNGKIVKGKYGYYKIFHGKIYNTNSIGIIYLNSKGIPMNNKPWDFSITKNVIALFISFFLLCYLFIRMKHSYKNDKIKWSFGIFLEFLILFIRDKIAIPNIGEKKYKKYFPFLLTSFFFILFNNLMGLIPVFPNITGNINITFVLAITTFIITNINASKSYWKHTFWTPGVPIIIKFLLAIIEFIGIFIRPLTLCIRLFANITAGHIIILSFICLIFIFQNFFIAGFSIIFGFFISMLEIMVSFLQAFIFTTLSSLLIGMSVKNYESKTH